MVGGLLLSQVLTLYTTPVIYLYLDRLQRWLSPGAQGPHAEPGRQDGCRHGGLGCITDEYTGGGTNLAHHRAFGCRDPTPPCSLTVADCIPGMQARAADLDETQSFPADDIVSLRDAGALRAPLPRRRGR